MDNFEKLPEITPWTVFLSEIYFCYFFRQKLSRSNWLEILQVVTVLLHGNASSEAIAPIAAFTVEGSQYTFHMSALSIVRQLCSGSLWEANLSDQVLVDCMNMRIKIEDRLKNAKANQNLFILGPKGSLELEAKEFQQWNRYFLRLGITKQSAERKELLKYLAGLQMDHKWVTDDKLAGGREEEESMSDMDFDEVMEGVGNLEIDRKRKRSIDDTESTR